MFLVYLLRTSYFDPGLMHNVAQFIILWMRLLSAIRPSYVSCGITDQSLKCYMCTSLMTEGCDDPKAHNLEPVECTLGKMGEWQRSIQQHNVLNAVSSIFEVDNLQSHQTAAPKDMACAKMVLKISNQDVTVRSCQTAKTETIDPCKAIESKLAGDIFHLEHCDLCMHDACNHAIVSTPRTFFIFLSAIGVLALGILYQRA